MKRKFLDDLDYREANGIEYAETLRESFFDENNKKLMIIGLWEAVTTSMYNQHRVYKGCSIIKFASKIKGKSKNLTNLVSTLHKSRNKVAHGNNQVKKGVKGVTEVFKKYNGDIKLLDKDLKLLTVNTEIKLDAEQILKVFCPQTIKISTPAQGFNNQVQRNQTDTTIDINGNISLGNI